jgi:hypothetical protein
VKRRLMLGDLVALSADCWVANYKDMTGVVVDVVDVDDVDNLIRGHRAWKIMIETGDFLIVSHDEVTVVQRVKHEQQN